MSSLYTMQEALRLFTFIMELGVLFSYLEAWIWIKLENLYIKNLNGWFLETNSLPFN